MEAPLVRCRSCEREWHSVTQAAGLRDIGKCPRCGGELAWAAGHGPGEPPEAVVAEPVAGAPDVAPHLVLGVPRR